MEDRIERMPQAEPSARLALLPDPLELPSLPVPLTSLIGRQRERAFAQSALLQGGTRVLTITGPGGVGKTHFALQVASDLRDAFAEGAGFIPLAALTDPALVGSAIAHRFGLRDEGSRPVLDRLMAALDDAELLLVLDNVEHLTGAEPLLSALVDGCPRLKMLITSRTRLDLPGGHHLHLRPLPVVDPDRLPPLQEVAATPAIHLFLERAQAVQADFRLTEENARRVATICCRLDGLPLAIELAAARLPVLPLDAIVHRLQDRFHLLTAGGRDKPARLQTLRNAIAWSYDLLTPEEQIHFRRLAVFAGGFTCEAAEFVSRDVSGVGGRKSLEPVLASLDRQNLLTRDGHADPPRYVLLESIHTFAWERLAAAGETGSARAAHAAWCLDLARRAAEEVDGAAQAGAFDRLEREIDNLRSALAWHRETRNTGAALSLAGALAPFWRTRGYLTEGRRWLADILALPAVEAQPASLRARALLGAQSLALIQNDYDEALALGQHALALFEETADSLGAGDTLVNLGIGYCARGAYSAAIDAHQRALAAFSSVNHRSGMARALSNIGVSLEDQGNYPRARDLYREALALYRAMNDLTGISVMLNDLGLVAIEEGCLDQAPALFDEALAVARKAGDQWAIAFSLDNLGKAARMAGDLDGASGWIDDALHIRRSLNDKWGIANSLDNLGRIALARGRPADAAQHFLESLTLRWSQRDQWALAKSLRALGALGASRGDPARAARVLGAADALRETLGMHVPPSERSDYERALLALQHRIGAAGFAVAWEAGRRLALAEAVREATAIGAGPGGIARAGAPSATRPLSPRETEVLRLMAAGYTDRDIASALFIGVRTVHTHVANILSKLGAQTRAGAAAEAERRALI